MVGESDSVLSGGLVTCCDVGSHSINWMTISRGLPLSYLMFLTKKTAWYLLTKQPYKA